MNEEMCINPIAHIYNDYTEKFGIPRQSGIIGDVESKIIFTPEYRDFNAVRGLEGYSHIWLIWGFSENGRQTGEWSPTVRPPRLGGNTRMGVFSTRSPFRPNSLGLSSVCLTGIETEGKEAPVLTVTGADIKNGTPVYDIKPYITYCDCHPEACSGFAEQVKDYRLQPVISQELMEKIPVSKRAAVTGILAQDPRPGYQQDENRIYGFRFADMNIQFAVEGDRIIVKEVIV